MSETISYAEFEKVDIRIGTVVEARVFPEARKPAFILLIDFGPEIGVKKSSAQITVHYTPETLIGRQVLGVVNFPAAPDRSGALGSADAGVHGCGWGCGVGGGGCWPCRMGEN